MSLATSGSYVFQRYIRDPVEQKVIGRQKKNIETAHHTLTENLYFIK